MQWLFTGGVNHLMHNRNDMLVTMTENVKVIVQKFDVLIFYMTNKS